MIITYLKNLSNCCRVGFKMRAIRGICYLRLAGTPDITTLSILLYCLASISFCCKCLNLICRSLFSFSSLSTSSLRFIHSILSNSMDSPSSFIVLSYFAKINLVTSVSLNCIRGPKIS